jgi:hypothetical protein
MAIEAETEVESVSLEKQDGPAADANSRFGFARAVEGMRDDDQQSCREVVAMVGFKLQQMMRRLLGRIKSGYCRNGGRAELRPAYSYLETQRTSEVEAGSIWNRQKTARAAGQVRSGMQVSKKANAKENTEHERCRA